MSRRTVDPAAERTARNAQTIKSLLKLEGNKSCADCKRNKHPRWASWNLGIFVCIRCSGIHRGMGTHISKVKSVDLDSWTDEQLQSVLVWGNSRANKYWEAKLAPGHVPSEAKMENFIRTKYDSKRWVMDGPIPDPATLDAEGDDDIPLNLVKEKQDLQRSTSQRTVPGSAPGGSPATVRRAPQADLLASEASMVQRANSTPGTSSRQSNFQAAPAPPPKISKPADSLLGLDFFAQDPQPPVSRSSNATPTGAAGQSRPDLKQSILSLYASAPKPQPQQSHHGSQGSINGFQSPSQQPQSSFGGLDDAFGGLSFSNTTSPPPQQQAQKPNAFAGLGSLQSHRSPVSSPPPTISSGGFFNAKPAPKPTPYTNSRTTSSSSDFGAFGAAPALPASPPVQSSGMNDLFDFSTPAVASPPKPVVSPAASHASVFNLTASQPAPKAQPAPAATSAASSGWSNFDAMGTNDAWSSAKPAPAQAAANDFGWGSGPPLASQSIVPGGNGFGQADSTPKVSADEEFGGWSSAPPAPPVTKTSHNAPKPATGFGAASEDLFSNVWE
ncbi:hypothetical protein V502_06670 [Pseudogymnoascus sp. VKM F-4520 (FW-2644)]|nr:hypothetical protein V502_06670 [Pseudogymnoascus sp. VKM F-4520 (FW-2644)]